MDGHAVKLHHHELLDPRDESVRHQLNATVLHPLAKKSKKDGKKDGATDYLMSADEPVPGPSTASEAVQGEGQEVGGSGAATPTKATTKRGGKLNIAPEPLQHEYFGKTDPESIPVDEYKPYYEREFGYTRYNYDEYLSKAKSHGSGWALEYANLKRPPTLTKQCLGVVVCQTCDFNARPETVAKLLPGTLRCPVCEEVFLQQIPCRGKEGRPVTLTFLTRDQQTVYLRNDGLHNHRKPPLDKPRVGTLKGTKEKKIHWGTSRVGKKSQKCREREAADCSREQMKRKRQESECSVVSVHSERADRQVEGGAPRLQPRSAADSQDGRKRYEGEEVNLKTGRIDGSISLPHNLGQSFKRVSCPDKSVQETPSDFGLPSPKKVRRDVPSPRQKARVSSPPSQPMEEVSWDTSHPLIPTPIDKMECEGGSSEDAKARESGDEPQTLPPNIYSVTDGHDAKPCWQNLELSAVPLVGLQPNEETSLMNDGLLDRNSVNQSPPHRMFLPRQQRY